MKSWKHKVNFLLMVLGLVLMPAASKCSPGKPAELIGQIKPSQLRPELGSQRVTFTGEDSKTINLMKINGNEFITITPTISLATNVISVSPDGMQIVYSCMSEQLGKHIDALDTCVAQGERISCLREAISTANITIADLCLANLDGSARRLITTSQIAGAISFEDPSFSPDGRKVLFRVSFPNALELFEVNGDGSGLRQLTYGGFNAYPSYSPDGKQIVFMCEGEGGIPIQMCVMNAQGTGRRRLTADEGMEHLWPRYTPDGRYIVFSGYHVDYRNSVGFIIKNLLGRGDYIKLYALDVENLTVHCITSDERATALAFSSDGKEVVYQAYDRTTGKNKGIYVINIDGSNKRRLGDDWWDVLEQSVSQE